MNLQLNEFEYKSISKQIKWKQSEFGTKWILKQMNSWSKSRSKIWYKINPNKMNSKWNEFETHWIWNELNLKQNEFKMKWIWNKMNLKQTEFKMNWIWKKWLLNEINSKLNEFKTKWMQNEMNSLLKS